MDLSKNPAEFSLFRLKIQNYVTKRLGRSLPSEYIEGTARYFAECAGYQLNNLKFIEKLTQPESIEWLDAVKTFKYLYNPQDVFCVTEFVLFHELNVRNRVAIIVCSNSDGSQRMEPVFVGNRHVDFKAYYNDVNCMFTTDIFSDWLQRLDEAVEGRKILLCLAQNSIHRAVPLRNIQLFYFPEKVLVPLDREVVYGVRKVYKETLLEAGGNFDEGKSYFELFSQVWRDFPGAYISGAFHQTGIGGNRSGKLLQRRRTGDLRLGGCGMGLEEVLTLEETLEPFRYVEFREVDSQTSVSILADELPTHLEALGALHVLERIVNAVPGVDSSVLESFNIVSELVDIVYSAVGTDC